MDALISFGWFPPASAWLDREIDALTAGGHVRHSGERVPHLMRACGRVVQLHGWRRVTGNRARDRIVHAGGAREILVRVPQSELSWVACHP